MSQALINFLAGLRNAAKNSLNVSVTGSLTNPAETLQSAVSATGNGTALAVSNYPTAVFEVTGTYVGTVYFEGSADGGTTFYALLATPFASSLIANYTNSTGLFRANTTGLTHVRGRVGWTSGTSVTVKVTTSASSISSEAVNATVVAGLTNISASDTIQRGNDATPYSAGDVVSILAGETLVFVSIATASSMLVIYNAKMRIDDSSVPAGCTGFKVHLYSSAPTAIADNTAYNLPSGDRAKYLGNFILPAPTDLGDTIACENDSINKVIRLAGSSLYAIVETIGAYTPVVNTLYTLSFNAKVL